MRRRLALPLSLLVLPLAASCNGTQTTDSGIDAATIDTQPPPVDVADSGPTLCVPAYDVDAGVTCQSINPNPELFCIRLTCDAGTGPDADYSSCCELVG